MKLETIEMDPSQAAAKLDAARRQIKRYKNAPAQLLEPERGYAALEAGKSLVLLSQAIGRGGFDEQGRPRIAVARSDRRWVELGFSGFYSGRRGWVSLQSGYFHRCWPPPPSSGLVRRVPLRGFAGDLPSPAAMREANRSRALIPLVPPDVKEAAGNPDLSRTFTLFEADWEDPPVDPALLRHVGGDLYAVLAAWNLTDLERAVLAQTEPDD